MLGQERLAVGVGSGRIEFAEEPGERDELRIRERLAAEADDQVIEPGLADRGDDVGRERPGKIDAVYFGAQRVAELSDSNRRNKVTPAAAEAAGVYLQAAEGEEVSPAGKTDLWKRGWRGGLPPSAPCCLSRTCTG
jgi:hypothetical protein